MKTPSILSLTFILLAIISCSRASSCADDFLQCLRKQFNNYSSISNNIYTPINSSYSSILQLTIQNPRFASDPTSSPLIIITPQHESQIPPLIHCAQETKLQIRTRSGGHDFEGLSYRAQLPFVIIDLINLSDITVDVDRKTAWVGVGATIGSLYYTIAERSPILGFPAGLCPTVGLGGYISGGGYGTMMRKYGLAADNVIDAKIVDAKGRILDRKSMGEDLFWAIRGGGGASFCVILAWKVQLVDVPKRVTVFRVSRTLEQNATQLIHRWQHIAPNLDKDLFLGIMLSVTNSTQRSSITINASFYSLFLGGIDRLLTMMQESFPELGLVREDCAEVSWIQAMVFIASFPIETPPQVLLNRVVPNTRKPFKGKSNYVQEPIPEYGLEGLWRLFYEEEAGATMILMSPLGGRMAEISESAIPFPHRAGNLYKMLQVVFWEEDENQDSYKFINWARRLDAYLTPYVSRCPRAAYVNYRDLDLGVNNVHGETSYAQASIWGNRYFKNNFDRLVRVKTEVDPENFFKNEQSIPPLRSRSA
ncbi:tetrahydroberberine oxidase-like [Salvia miltiorrhiza]|uniref:tetrahydroberberine oxidase-like n=1 Tax=Salvia miltiorrhiza TaxID=226208 RepID=UPI0025ACC521|nr:tetrahydroberberine oxidase-like [Salvia miltiorrhiza]